MQTKTLSVVVPKEMQEVSECIQHLISDIKAGKKVAEIAAGRLGELMAAVDGYDQLGEEVKSQEGADCVALLGSGVYKALQTPKAV